MYFCVAWDSDNTQLYKPISGRPFIYETHFHSIESYQCFPEILAEIIREITHEEPSISIRAYLQGFSEIMFDWLLYRVYYKKHEASTAGQNESLLNLAFKFDSLSVLIDFHGTVEHYLIDLGIRMDAFRTDVIPLLGSPAQDKLAELEEEMLAVGITRQNVYFYLQGHSIYSLEKYSTTAEFGSFGLILKMVKELRSVTIGAHALALSAQGHVPISIERYKKVAGEPHIETLLETSIYRLLGQSPLPYPLSRIAAKIKSDFADTAAV